MKNLSFAVVSLMLLTGCSLSKKPILGEAPASKEIIVVVKSHNWSDINIYVESGGQVMRLGQVTTERTESFTLKQAIHNNQIRLLVKVIGSANQFDYASDPILANPGSIVTLTVERQISLTSFSVRL